jgi:hypothetical protein
MLRTVREGKVYDIGLSEIEHRPEQFMIVFEGQLEIAADGQYLFYLMSDDGSKLFIDETEVVSNDGVHSLQERSGSIQLTSGLHPFKLLYLQAGANAMLRLSYEGPGLSKQQVPATRYHRATNN